MYLNILHALATNGYSSTYLLLFAFASISFAISIIIAKNPVYSVLFLIGLFLAIALYYMMLGLYFIGLSYLLVYVGAISILFLFILMLINVRISELVTEGKNSAILAIIAIIAFAATVNFVLGAVSSNNGGSTASVNGNSFEAFLVEVTHISSIGNMLYTGISMFLIITSLILLLAMVGCILITKANDISGYFTTPPAMTNLSPKLAGWPLDNIPEIVDFIDAAQPGTWSGIITGPEGTMGVEVEISTDTIGSGSDTGSNTGTGSASDSNTGSKTGSETGK